MLPLSEKVIKLDIDVESPIDAIRIAGDLLVQEGKVEQAYVEGMVNAFHELGAYFVIAPGIALPHARPDQTVKEVCLSLVRLKKPVVFGHPKNDPVQLVCAIAGVDKKAHIQMLRDLASILSDELKLKEILEAENAKQVLSVIQQS
jgi:PTS system ascorbate-specific IIA component